MILKNYPEHGRRKATLFFRMGMRYDRPTSHVANALNKEKKKESDFEDQFMLFEGRIGFKCFRVA